VGPFDTQETSGSIVPSLTFAFLEAVSFSVKSTATEVHLNIHYRVPIIVGLEIVAHRGYEVDASTSHFWLYISRGYWRAWSIDTLAYVAGESTGPRSSLSLVIERVK